MPQSPQPRTPQEIVAAALHEIGIAFVEGLSVNRLHSNVIANKAWNSSEASRRLKALAAEAQAAFGGGE